MWDYPEALAWLYARQGLGIKLGLEKVERLLEALDNPHHRYRAIHVAGTNGKGSVTLMLEDALRRAGQRVGSTTSPHLVRFTERIRIDGDEVAPEQVAVGLWKVKAAVAPLDAEGEPPTFFECVTALAFLLFAQADVDWAVVETGMGGRLDATNVLKPALTIITNVTMDHMQFLGDTLADIAFEKAGIMKPGVPCVTAAAGDALWVLKARSHELAVPMSIIGSDYHIVPGPVEGGLHLLRPRGESHYKVGLAGAHQWENAAVVVAAAEALATRGQPIPEAALRGALAHARNPGRLETFDYDGLEVLVDGAHNPAAAEALASHLEATPGYDLVFGACSDKDWAAVLAAAERGATRTWTVPIRNPRTLDAAQAKGASGRAGSAQPSLAAALDAAKQAGARRVVVAGSLFLAGEARALLLGLDLEDLRGSQ